MNYAFRESDTITERLRFAENKPLRIEWLNQMINEC